MYFVAAFEENEDLTDGICHTKVVHLCVYFVHGGENNLFEVLIHGVAHAFVSHNAAEIFYLTWKPYGSEGFEGVGKVGVQTLHHQIPGDHAVVLEGHLMKHKVTHCVYAEELYQIVCVDHVSFWTYSFFRRPEGARDDQIPASAEADPEPSGRSASRLYGNE